MCLAKEMKLAVLVRLMYYLLLFWNGDRKGKEGSIAICRLLVRYRTDAREVYILYYTGYAWDVRNGQNGRAVVSWGEWCCDMPWHNESSRVKRETHASDQEERGIQYSI